ncbi:MAG: hypothetical protein HZA53_02815, partial [Planctomycetes bacterium]|nr:hypothetical protein [Planctomycetota bacterium]
MRSSNLFLAFLVALPAALPAPRAHASALVLPALVLPALVLPAQADRSELVRELVDSPFLASGDVDGWVDRVVELLLAQKGPPSPVDEAALQLLARRGDELADPARWPEVLERLALVSTLDAHARSFLARLTTEERLARMDTDALRRSREHDAFPEYLASFRILAPLAGPETGAPVSLAALSADPGFEREHAGLRGERVRWSIGKREPLRTEIAPAEWMEPVEGWCVLAFEFDAEHGGAAAIEFDLHGSYALRSLPFLLARDRSWRASVGDPTWSYSIDGGAPVTVDAVARETAPVVLAPFELRAGRNRVLVLCKADAYSSFALRVLVPDGAGVSGGKPLVLAPVDGAGLSPERSRLGRGTGAPGAQCASFEERLPREAPDELALLGVLLAGDQRPIAGLEFLRRATTAAPDRVGLAALFARTQNDAPYLPEAWRRSQSRAKFEALAARGANLDVELALARTQVLEDHEEEALLRLDRAREQFARTPAPLLELARTYPKLELDKAGDDAHDA